MDYLFLLGVLSGIIFFALHVTAASSFPKPLSAEEERECFEKMKKGSKEAKNKLIEHNLRLVAHIIKKYYSNSSEQDDLISIGTIGLIKAVSTFNYEKGTRFATYAARCIENEILMYFRGKKKYAQDVSLSETIDCDKDGNALSIMDVMADERSVTEDIEDKLCAENLYKIIDSELLPREKEIIYMRYGLKGQRAYTQREISQKLGISRSYVSRIEKKAIDILRERMES
ncbi:MAG: RNA polymerase sporulation sigma factor SigK [Oscillospiraceae bacterium]|nr:RNA polymerase sporulation sigma factor SigK [Oscillospiraceae bacterium]MBR3610286.1 RNA polymerase sporulation sigma factor SigK [Oscillospiraceae bacterium]